MNLYMNKRTHTHNTPHTHTPAHTHTHTLKQRHSHSNSHLCPPVPMTRQNTYGSRATFERDNLPSRFLSKSPLDFLAFLMAGSCEKQKKKYSLQSRSIRV